MCGFKTDGFKMEPARSSSISQLQSSPPGPQVCIQSVRPAAQPRINAVTGGGQRTLCLAGQGEIRSGSGITSVGYLQMPGIGIGISIISAPRYFIFEGLAHSERKSNFLLLSYGSSRVFRVREKNVEEDSKRLPFGFYLRSCGASRRDPLRENASASARLASPSQQLAAARSTSCHAYPTLRPTDPDPGTFSLYQNRAGTAARQHDTAHSRISHQPSPPRCIPTTPPHPIHSHFSL
jgi:hypothetical protein